MSPKSNKKTKRASLKSVIKGVSTGIAMVLSNASTLYSCLSSKTGFNPISKKDIAILNLEKIQSYIDKKTIKTSDVLNKDLFKKLKLINKNSTKLKILGSGEIKDKVNIEANLASKSAVEKLEKIGGSIQLKK